MIESRGQLKKFKHKLIHHDSLVNQTHTVCPHCNVAISFRNVFSSSLIFYCNYLMPVTSTLTACVIMRILTIRVLLSVVHVMMYHLMIPLT